MIKNTNSYEYFISIVIPVYNGSQTIGSCLRSVFQSSYPNFECIIVDDHSNDNTLDFVESFDVKIIRLNKQKGAAYARNRGAEAAKGDVLVFIDADVEIYSDSLNKILRTFEDNPEISALFGSYDDQPWSQNFLSQYKNLFHHYIHQTSGEDAVTFWTGCGAIKREFFFQVGKFNEGCRMMEDVEFGYRLKAKDFKIRLNKQLFVRHLKRYSFLSLLKSDLFDRAVPWTILMLDNRKYTNDLNLKPNHKLSAFVLMLLIMSIFLIIKSVWFGLAIPVLSVLFFLMNYDFYRFYLKKRGMVFTLKVVPLHFLYYIYSSLGFLIGYYKYYIRK
ncbi:MAG: glycosyltransferase family 2 protein [Thermodesulfobacteriota bacterium]|nr:glycosyltransferase family 2 protein [Thermodesulfobacteriota bacterium]